MDREPPLRDQVHALLEHVTSLIRARNPQVLQARPLSHYMALLDEYPTLAALGYSSPQIKRVCGEISGVIGDDGLDLYHRALLLSLILRAMSVLPDRNLPEEIKVRFEDNFARITSDIETSIGQQVSYLYVSSPFCKDLAICTLRLIPVGVAKVHSYHLPRRMFLAGLRGASRAFRFAVLERGGLSPYYDTHMHSQDPQAMAEFGAEGWVNFYTRIAELLRRNPQMKGLAGSTWLHDPILATISPHLAILHDVQINNGAHLFLLGPCNANSIKDATMKSSTRRRLYEEGKYIPTEYCIVWPRDALIAWADSKLEVSPATPRPHTPA